jgi:hypothetical protein
MAASPLILRKDNNKDERSDDQKDSDFPHADLTPPKKAMKTMESPLMRMTTSLKRAIKNPAPAPLTIASDVFLEEYNKAFADHNKIREDKSLSEEVRKVHLRKSKLRLNAIVRASWARDVALIPPDETSASSAAVSVSVPKDNSQVSLSDEDERLKRIETGRRVLQRLRASKEIAASTQASSSNAVEDWTSLGATFDRAASKPGAFQGIANRLDKIPDLEPPAARRIVDVAADKDQWKEFLASADLQSAPPASDAVRERNASSKHLRENSPGKGERAPSTSEAADSNQDQDMRAKENPSAEAQDLSKSDGESDSSSEEVDEVLFLENLEKLAASGDLDTVEGVRQAFVNAFGEEMPVSGGFCFQPHSQANSAH